MSLAERLISEVLALPSGERASLAHRILESLDADADPDAESAWIAELETRASDVADGGETVAWAEARQNIQAELKRRRAARTAP